MTSPALQKGQLPDCPTALACAVCDTQIGDQEWDWAAMPENGPVHLACFITDADLLAELDKRGPCTGCDTSCDSYQACVNVDMLVYADGINNCMIVRAGVDADGLRAQGYKVVQAQ